MIRYQNSGYKKNQFRKLETNKYKINESQRSIKVTESQLFLNNMVSKASEDHKRRTEAKIDRVWKNINAIR